MPWYEVHLTSAQAAAGAHGRIQDQFMAFFHKVRAPPDDMAMFSGQGAGADALHLYFLLPAGDLSEVFVRLVGAIRCERPPPDVGFDAGHNETLQRFRTGGPL